MAKKISKSFGFRALSATFAASAMVLTTPASAQTSDEPTRITVSYADLDIGRAPGAKVLLQRIRNASVRVCGGQPDLRELQQSATFDRCRDTAVGAGVADVDSPILTALAGHNPQPIHVAHR